MNEIDDAIEQIESSSIGTYEGDNRTIAIYKDDLRTILEQVFGDLPDCSTCDLFAKLKERGFEVKPATTQQNIEAEIREKLQQEGVCGSHFQSEIIRIIRPSLAVNDRRALVRLRDELARYENYLLADKSINT